MKNRFIHPLLLSLSLLLVSCGGGGGGNSTIADSRLASSPPQSFTQAEKDFVYGLFMTEYLWFNEVASNVDYSAFDTPQTLIEGLRVPKDRWSFMVTKEEYENNANQKTAGFGFGYINDFTVFLVRIDSPAYNKLLRGDKILEVNNEAVSYENIAQASKNLNVKTTFKVLRNATKTTVVITPREYNFKVTLGKILNNTIGYLRYDSFTGSSVSEFEEEFRKFKKAGITDLIIDLRYNGGGSVDVASTLLDNIANNADRTGKRQVYLDWNKNYQSKNSSYYFSDELETNDLDMQRVVFLVTKNSASASELVISALKPYLGDANVVTIGEATHGKPVGMAGKSYGSDYYFLINFYVKNNAGAITNFDGIDPTCKAEDDLTHLMGDPQETMLKSALHYIDTGSCL